MLGMMIIVAFWAAECLAFPIFIRAQWPQKCVKSFVWKVISATIFVGYGVYLMFGYSLVDIKFSKYMNLRAIVATISTKHRKVNH